MELILLSGNSKKNKLWIEKVDDKLGKYFNKSVVQSYLHWNTNQEFINFDLEKQRLSEEIQAAESYAIFAKSIGAILALNTIFDHNLKPSWCLFAGLPMELSKKEHYPLDEWFKNIDYQVIILQNENDPAGSFKVVSDYLKHINNKNIRLIKLEGNTHDYDNLEKFEDCVKDLLSK